MKTLFVIGAGASSELGIPNGRALIDRILSVGGQDFDPNPSRACQVFHDRLDLGSLVLEDTEKSCPYPGETPWDRMGLALSAFKTHLTQFAEDSSYPSIDRFLGENRQYRLLGKFLLAYCLHPYRNRVWGESAQRSPPWLQTIVERIEPIREVGFSKPVDVVTFNYERNIELATAAWFRKQLGGAGFDQLALTLVRDSLRVIHVHGQLAPDLPTLMAEEDNPIGRVSFMDYFYDARDIRIVPEADDGDINVRLARFRVCEAQTVIFIGFAYDDRNLQLLGLDANTIHASGTRFIGTSFGMPNDRENYVRKYFRSKIELFPITASQLVTEELPRLLSSDWGFH